MGTEDHGSNDFRQAMGEEFAAAVSPPDASPRECREASRRLSALAAAAMLLALSAGCDPRAGATPSVAEIEAFIGTTLPPSVRNLHAADEAGIDRLMRLRFDAPDGEAAGFAARLLPDGRETGADPGLLAMGSDLDWWLAAMPPGAEGGGMVSATNRTYKLISAPAGVGTRRVWLAVFTQ